MAEEIRMPALSPTMTEGTLAKWLVKEGDEITAGMVIAEIETDKATMEVEAVDEGTLAKILVAEGTQNVAVNSLIAVLAEEGEDPASLELPAAATPAPATPAAATQAPATPAPAAPAPSPVAAPTPAPVVAPAPAPVAAPEVASVSSAVSSALSSGARVFASPLAKRLAAQNDINLSSLTGSGPYGRIIKADIDAALAGGMTRPATAASADSSGGRFVPHSAMRRTIAARLQQSKQDAPHFYLSVDCEIDTLLAARKALNEKAPEGVKISVNDMVIRASAMALKAVPDVNGWFEEEGCRYFDTADICMAVALDGGLITPIIPAVETLGLAEISQKSKDLAKRARDGKLAPEEYTGGGFTISNLGMFGVKEFSAVINPPQGAILAVGAGTQRPVVKDGQLSIATVMTVTLSCDHRIVDGALGAQWLQAFKGYIEQPVTMLL
ncbi:MAG: pyruvate dehydrogenase complex dihydrolipoamide acetyltransferase [Candidatus Puniceispirillaceae bacterium]